MLKDWMQDRQITYLMTFLCVDSNVLLTRNLKQTASLVNKIVGFVKQIIDDVNENLFSSLPMYILVDFGKTYTKQNFFSSEV